MTSRTAARAPHITEELNTSQAQIYALVRSGDLVGIQIGGRAQWRVERAKLEEYIERLRPDRRRSDRAAGEPADRRRLITPRTAHGRRRVSPRTSEAAGAGV